jgi:hypothetical protein
MNKNVIHQRVQYCLGIENWMHCTGAVMLSSAALLPLLCIICMKLVSSSHEIQIKLQEFSYHNSSYKSNFIDFLKMAHITDSWYMA